MKRKNRVRERKKKKARKIVGKKKNSPVQKLTGKKKQKLAKAHQQRARLATHKTKRNKDNTRSNMYEYWFTTN